MKCHIFPLPCTVQFTAWLVDSCFSSDIFALESPGKWTSCFLQASLPYVVDALRSNSTNDTFYQFRLPKWLVTYHLRSIGLLFSVFPYSFLHAYFSLSLTHSSSFLCTSSLNMPSQPILTVKNVLQVVHFFFIICTNCSVFEWIIVVINGQRSHLQWILWGRKTNCMRIMQFINISHIATFHSCI